MRLVVRVPFRADADGAFTQQETHEGALVEASTSDGELLVVVRGPDGRAVRWTRYARDCWEKVWSEELNEDTRPPSSPLLEVAGPARPVSPARPGRNHAPF